MKLLICTGDNEESDQAVRLGAYLTRFAHGSITILTVIDDEKNRSDIDLIQSRALSLSKSEAVDARTKVVVGEEVAEIIREAEAGNYDLIIIGSRPSHTFLGKLLGPVSERIIENSPCPVLIVKGWAGSVQNVLLCLSGVSIHEGPSRGVARLAPIFLESRITLLHVMSQISASPAVREGWQLQANAGELIEEDTPEGRMLEERIEMLQKIGFQVSAKVRHGLVLDEILEEAKSGSYDLLVIGAHGTKGWKRYLLDDVAHQIIVQSDRPVLVV